MSSEYDIIPDHILEAINAYVVRGQDPGHFIKAVAENDLLNAVNYGDEDCMLGRCWQGGPVDEAARDCLVK